MSFFSNLKKPSEDRLSFQIHDVDLSIVNALRRIGLQEIPNVALDYDITGASTNENVTINKNTGVLHNEFLLHRLSLVPFHFSLEEIETFDDQQYLLKLQVSNKSQSDLMDVTTEHIEIFDVNNKKKDSAFHKRILPANSITKDHILLTKLKPGEEINITFRLNKGTGSMHSRWSPVSQCTYSFIPESSKETLGILESQRNYEKNNFGEPNGFLFSIQSECGITPTQVFKRSIDILMDKINNIIAALEKNDTAVTINNTTQDYFYHICIRDEDHTLVNVLHSIIYNLTIRDQADRRLIYIGYCCPHPLDRMMLMKIKMADDTDVRAFLVEKIQMIREFLVEFSESWNNFSANK